MASDQFDGLGSDMSIIQWVNLTLEIRRLFTESERFVQMLSLAPVWRRSLSGWVDSTEEQFPCLL